ncbi:MAG: tetratricopeptide repeat protein [Flavobacteriales bacterium]
MKKLLYSIAWVLFPVFSIGQITATQHYTIYYKINNNDTSGLYKIIFTENRNSNTFYTILSKGDYMNYCGKTKEALNEYTTALSMTRANTKDSLFVLVNFKIGELYYFSDNYPEALKYFNKVSLIYNSRPANYLQAKLYIQIGSIHHTLGKKSDAEKNFKTALVFYRARKDLKKVVSTQNKLAIVHMDSGEFDDAAAYFDSCLIFRKSNNDYYGIGQTLNNIGTLHYRKEEYKTALGYFTQGYENRIKGNAPESGLVESQINIGKSYWKLGDKKQAVRWLEQAFDIAVNANNYELQRRATEQLKDLYVEINEYKKAFKAQEIYFMAKDSLYGLDKRIAVGNYVFQNQLESKIQRDSISSATKIRTQKILSSEKEKRNRIIVYFLAGGMVFLLFFVFQLYRTGAQRKKANAIILQQRDSIDRKQKEILDSINYAKRIQNAILAGEDEIQKALPDSFLLYLPKDIVAGDFYFFESTPSHIFIAAADCTGHGVPGAMVSVVCSNALTRCVKEFGLTDPGKILDKTRTLVIETFEKSGSDVKDGMDISLLSITKDKRLVKWAGANNPLWYMVNNELKEIKPTKQPVGKSDSGDTFVSHEIPTGSFCYLFTDGYVDQFGGDPSSESGGKKLKAASFKKLIISVYADAASVQKEKMAQAFENWKGNLEQVDDVCVLGIRI